MGSVTTTLAQLRAEYRLTQADLASLAAVSRQTINSIETGRFEPSLSLALRLARLFGQPVETLFALDESEAERAAARVLAPPGPRFAAS
jgi:putative transcriptional regulator